LAEKYRQGKTGTFVGSTGRLALAQND